MSSRAGQGPRSPFAGSPGQPAGAGGAPPEETALFEEAVSDVEPLPQEQRPPEQTPPEPVPLSARDREVIGELDRLIAGEGSSSTRICR